MGDRGEDGGWQSFSLTKDRLSNYLFINTASCYLGVKSASPDSGSASCVGWAVASGRIGVQRLFS
jgi:hypothetical protein